MIYSKAGVRIDWFKLTSSEKTAKSAHWACNFFQQLADPNSTLITDKSLSRSVDENIFFNFTMYLSDLQFFHLAPKPSSLAFKNRAYGAKKNCFHPSFTNLRRTAGELNLFGYNARHKSA